MSMSVQTNVAAINSHRSLGLVGNMQSRASARLSSGFRINSAADDAAGLAISEKMRAQIRGLDQASRNGQDGISLIQTAEGAMNIVNDMVIRIRELVVQAANDTNAHDGDNLAQSDRIQIQREINSLMDEIDAITLRTEFNTRTLINGDWSREAITIDIPASDGLPTYVDLAALAAAIPEGGFVPFTGNDIADLLDWLVDPTNFEDAPAPFVLAKPQGLTWSDYIETRLVAGATTLDAIFGTGFQAWLATVVEEYTDFAPVAELADVAALLAVTVDDLGPETFEEMIQRVGGNDTFDLAAFVGGLTDLGELLDAAVLVGSDNSDIVTTDGRALTIGDLNAWAVAYGATSWANFVTTHLTANPAVEAGTEEQGGQHLWFHIGANSVQGITLNIEAVDVETLSSVGAGDHALRVSDQTLYHVNTHGRSFAALRNRELAHDAGVMLTHGEDINRFLDGIDAALAHVAGERANLGAVQNRLEFTIENLDIASENLSAANSRIRDADMAQEMMRFTQSNVLQQAAISMLAQANQAPQSILQLLR